MSALPLGEQERADALVLSALLRASARTLGAWSLALMLLAFVLNVVWLPSFGGTCLWGLMLLCGCVAQYFLFRLLLDERLFHQLGHGHLPSLTALDIALTRLGLRAESLHERAWSDRLRGARSLLRRFAAVVLLQTALALLALFLRGIL